MKDLINKVHCCDCLELLKKIPDKSIDMIFQDPPYNTTSLKFEFDLIKVIDNYWKEWNRIIKDKHAILLFGVEPFSSYLRLSNINYYKYDWIWYKSKPTGISLSKTQPMRNHEIISVFNSCFYYPIKEEREGFTEQSKKRLKTANTIKYKNYTSEHNGLKETDFKSIDKLRMPTSIKKFGSLPNRLGLLHPTQKPLDLFKYLIQTYTIPGNVIFDGFAGSFTTALAAEELGRNWICCDNLQEYCDVGQKRLDEFHLTSGV